MRKIISNQNRIVFFKITPNGRVLGEEADLKAQKFQPCTNANRKHKCSV
jgi:hypothetical protein